MTINMDFIKKIGLICMIMALCVIAGGVYIKTIKPVYEAKTYLSRATSGDLANFSYSLSDLLPPLTESQVYNIFTKNLNSQATKQQFFKQHFLPHHTIKKEKMDALYRRFNANLIIRNDVTQGKYSGYKLMVKHTDPAQAAYLLKSYIQLTQQKARKDLIQMIQSQNNSMKIKLAQKIALLRSAAKQERNDRLIKLREALTIAKAGALKEPVSAVSKEPAFIALNMNEQTDPGTIYLRGEKAIRAEIANIVARTSDDSFIPGLRILQSEYNAIQQLTIDPDRIKPFRVEGRIETPETPVSPNPLDIMLLSFIIGGLLSGLFLLSTRKQQIIQSI